MTGLLNYVGKFTSVVFTLLKPMIIALISVFFLGWLLASTIGTMAYFANEPKTPKID